MRHLIAALSVIFLLANVGAASAQGALSVIEAQSHGETTAQDPAPAPASDERLEQLIQQARQTGTPFIVMPLEQAEAATQAAATPASTITHAVAVRNAMRDTFAALPNAGSEIAETLLTADETRGMAWFGYGLLLTVLVLAVAFLVRALIRRRGRRFIAKLAIDPEKDRVSLVSLVVLGLGVRLLSLAGFVAAGFLTMIAIVPFTDPIGWTAHVALLTLTIFLFMRDVFLTLYSPGDASARMPNLTDAEAAAMQRQIVVIAAISLSLLGASMWLVGLGLDSRVGDLIRIAASIVATAMLIGYVIVHRKQVARIFRGRAPEPPTWRKVLAGVWHIVVIAYLVVATVHNIQMIVLSDSVRTGPIIAPILGALAGFVAFALALIVIDRRVKARQEALYRASAGTARGVGPDGAVLESPPAPPTSGEDVVEPVTRWQLRWKRFADRVAAMSALIVAIVVTAAVSGNLKLHTEAGEWVGIAVVLYLTYVAYQALRTWIDGRIEEEEGPVLGDVDDGMGPGSSRLATLLPLMRNVLVVVVFCLVGTTVLAGMGVNVAPLFAGAGIIGLAVGFGAQSLIRDIFSGAFFLFDDAFRRGEYLDCGGVMGSVEKISVRSFQLRHQNGPLHTIPFGEIKQLTNYSRDWAIMKLKLRLVYGTDIEKVRKIIKNLGKELAADPEIGHLFLDPLKSQGVVEMEDSAMICRVKFMTRPGDQFLARRHVYTRIHELFAREGIQFANRQVTVRVENAPPGVDISPALGAVQPVIDQQA